MQQQVELLASVPEYQPITIQSDIAYLSSFQAAKAPSSPVESCNNSSRLTTIAENTETKINHNETNTPLIPTTASTATIPVTRKSTSTRSLRRMKASEALTAYKTEPAAVDKEAVRLRRLRERQRMSRVLANYQRESRERFWVTVPARDFED